ncbi:hypothetical protein [Streptomyces sp. NPDC003077]|uniref:hypothetical protein n=1 Tax=Streptomyces sp. NPDC003077 TaxID=3154443 RepID=UPI0033BBBC85
MSSAEKSATFGIPKDRDADVTGEPLRVSLAELRRSVDLLLRHVEAVAAGDAVVMNQDHFWSVPADELYDVSKEPVDLMIGQLSESWQHLRNLLADEDRIVGYHLVWLADVLRAIGQDISASPPRRQRS